MEARAHKLVTTLEEWIQWVVPVYQRHYEWEVGEGMQIPKLWADLQDRAIERLRKDDTPLLPHYFGTIIYEDQSSPPLGDVPRRFLVDGQQRITTFQITLAAIREVARFYKLDDLANITNEYLFNRESAGTKDRQRDKFKLWSSIYDRPLFQVIIPEEYEAIQRKYTPEHYFLKGSIRGRTVPKLLRAYDYLYISLKAFVAEREKLYEESPKDVVRALLEGFLHGFHIVSIQLKEYDDAQEIFASLNGYSKPLLPFDLIRNDVFRRAIKLKEDDEQLFENQWKVLEEPFWSKEIKQGRRWRVRSDLLIAYTVVAETARDISISKIVTEYQRYARDSKFESVSAELGVLIDYAKNYRSFAEVKANSSVNRIAEVLRVWDMSIFNPFVLWVMRYVKDEGIQERIFNLLESYLVRRELCDLTPKNYNNVAVGFIRAIRAARIRLEKLAQGTASDSSDTSQVHTDAQVGEVMVEGFAEYMASNTGDISRMPTDAEVAEEVAKRRVYNVITTPKLRFILLNIEHALHDEFDEAMALDQDLTIEHIMPRKWAENWSLQNGKSVSYESSYEAIIEGVSMDDETKAIVDARSHLVETLGNLTLLTRYKNPSLGNDGWSDKRGKLSASRLKMNTTIGATEDWNEDAIRSRSQSLSKVICERWKS